VKNPSFHLPIEWKFRSLTELDPYELRALQPDQRTPKQAFVGQAALSRSNECIGELACGLPAIRQSERIYV